MDNLGKDVIYMINTVDWGVSVQRDKDFPAGVIFLEITKNGRKYTFAMNRQQAIGVSYTLHKAAIIGGIMLC